MADMKNTNGRTLIDYMARDYDSFLRSMRAMIPDDSEWKDYKSEADFGNVLLQLFAHMGDILSYYQDRVANESFLGTAQNRHSIIHHLRLIGYKLSTAAPASAELTLFIPDTCKEKIIIEKGDAFATRSQKDTPSVRFEYTREQPLTIEVKPGTAKTYIGVPVEEGRLVKDEFLGESDGTPNQRFPLAHPRLILRSLGQGQKVHRDIILKISLGETQEEWTLQESLAFSQRENDFMIEIDEQDRATVIFGDDIYGAIPAKSAEIRAFYRVGGGRHGNVPKESIQTIVNAPQLALQGVTLTNKGPATGGADRESIDHAVMHAPGVFRSLKRAVTAEDYEALALNYKGVGKVRAEATNWNTITLYVAPEGGGHVSDVLRANLIAYFEDKRPVSTIIEIEDVQYVNIYVTAVVGISRYYSAEDIKEKVQQAVGRLLAFENVDFKQVLYLSKFYEAIEAIDGVEYVNITEFRDERQKEEPIERTGKIELGSDEIPKIPDDAYVGGIKVEEGD